MEDNNKQYMEYESLRSSAGGTPLMKRKRITQMVGLSTGTGTNVGHKITGNNMTTTAGGASIKEILNPRLNTISHDNTGLSHSNMHKAEP